MMQVLVVEDEVLIRMLVCDLLEEAGFRCTEAGNAEEALTLLDGGLCRPDILVTDYNLGPGMDGKALAREVLRRLPGLPVAYVTGNPECFEDRPLAASERLVAKPFASADLVAALRELRPAAPFLAGGLALARRRLALADPA
jgi:two-component system, OmpR family, response regulator